MLYPLYMLGTWKPALCIGSYAPCPPPLKWENEGGMAELRGAETTIPRSLKTPETRIPPLSLSRSQHAPLLELALLGGGFFYVARGYTLLARQ